MKKQKVTLVLAIDAGFGKAKLALAVPSLVMLTVVGLYHQYFHFY